MTKKILITGKNSYIGTSFMEYSLKNNINFDIEAISVRGEEWKYKDFSKYDIVINLAGIAHRKETKENKHLYYEVNRDLAVEIAKKAKENNVSHHIFLSTMSVYGVKEGYISKDTSLNPNNAYGKSKLQAEQNLLKLNDEHFKLTIMRPPMIYGPNAKGNYQTLAKFAKKTKLFPNINNKRSMLFIDNLSQCIVEIIKNKKYGLICPQNKEYVKTSQMINEIAKVNDNSIKFISWFNPLIDRINVNILKKVFGDLVYNKELSHLELNYNIVNFKDSIRVTENGE